jgi:D-serine deaminase-like pyridoxal phosphate-dependent protein
MFFQIEHYPKSLAHSGPTFSIHTPSRGTPLRGAKRKRTMMESEDLDEYDTKASSSGDIEFIDACPQGKFVKLRNKGTKVSFQSNITKVKNAFIHDLFIQISLYFWISNSLSVIAGSFSSRLHPEPKCW